MTTRWGIVATGRIAHKLAVAIQQSDTGQLVAVGSRTQESADVFASNYNGVTAYSSYDELVSASDVDAVYIATPHPQHAEWTIKCLNAGKAVLCEKPMGISHAEVMAMVHAAKSNNCFLMEAFMYRLHPQITKVVELLRNGAIGSVRHIHATFGFHAPYDPKSRLFANDLAGGGIMDVGCYPVSISRLIAGEEPHTVEGTGVLSDEGVDLYAAGMLYFKNGITARVATGVGQQLDNTVRVFGTQGSIQVPWPWRSPQEWEFELTKQGQKEVIRGDAREIYVSEVDEVDRCLKESAVESPAMTWDDSMGNARVLDEWRKTVGVKFEAESLANRPVPIHGSSTARKSDTMRYGKLPGITKNISRLVFGCDNQPNELHAMVMFDDFYESGGNTFDTAYIYGGNRLEQFLGLWLESRGIRDEAVVIGKGAHTPHNRPEFVESQLIQTLESLRTDHVDIYFLHRDNPEVPVGEWIDVLSDQRELGRLSVFGGSNWSLERVKEANDWAERHHRTGFSAVSNQFSLARMNEPVWPGCISANTDQYREFLKKNKLALFPWSSQARGFFTDRVDEIRKSSTSSKTQYGLHPSDSEIQRCWFSEDNFERRTRAYSLAKEKGVEPINIALAFVLAQAFPCFPLIGPRQLSETHSCLTALELDLSSEELKWLDDPESNNSTS
ncbi:MAG: oxidoreductase [Gammaproteobacteria bacterium]|nr:oxidoreductase [Gammaproteobacteria bacterium]MYD80249.1 oxidoreductase [Gammaproteobacteria bacterium]